MFPDEPGRPGKPNIIDYDNKSVCLKWAKPSSDGGRPITHYTVEVKDKFSVEWTEMAKTENDTPEAKVDGLKENMVYQFRVRAHNKAGESEPSEPTDNHLCKHRHCKYSMMSLTSLTAPQTFILIRSIKNFAWRHPSVKFLITNIYTLLQ